MIVRGEQNDKEMFSLITFGQERRGNASLLGRGNTTFNERAHLPKELAY